MGKKHIGSDFDDLLRDERLLDDVETVAAKRVIVFQDAPDQVGAGAQDENQQTGGRAAARSSEPLGDTVDA